MEGKLLVMALGIPYLPFSMKKDTTRMQLAHIEWIRITYSHAQYVKKRQDMMQWYSNFILKKLKVSDSNLRYIINI